MQAEYLAPAQSGTQILTQIQISHGQTPCRQHPARRTARWRHGMHEPVEGHMLLGGVKTIHIVEYDGQKRVKIGREFLHRTRPDGSAHPA